MDNNEVVTEEVAAVVENIQLHRLPLAVKLAQGVGQLLGLVGVVGEDQLRGGGGPAHAAGGVDAGGQAVPHGGGISSR